MRRPLSPLLRRAMARGQEQQFVDRGAILRDAPGDDPEATDAHGYPIDLPPTTTATRVPCRVNEQGTGEIAGSQVATGGAFVLLPLGQHVDQSDQFLHTHRYGQALADPVLYRFTGPAVPYLLAQRAPIARASGAEEGA